jgi:hypothetical protein
MNYYQPTKRKIFISFHHNDQVEAEAFIEQWGNRQDVFIPKVLGVSCAASAGMTIFGS